jgi:predicted ATP-grasp superfamily ATP-dependent carboligase
MKPRSHLVVGSRIRGTLVRNEAELRRTFDRYLVEPGQESLAAGYPELRWPLLQRYLPSARTCVYSVSGIKDSDRGFLAAILSVKREQWPPDIGISTVQVSYNDQRILESGLRTVDRMISCGIFELELLSDGERLLAIDLNPRAFGFIMLDIALGNDLPWLWWQTTLGMGERQTISSTPPLECRFLVPYCFGHAIGRLLGPSRAVSVPNEQSAGRRWISMLGHPRDPVPMLLANARLLRLLPHHGGLVRPYLAAAVRARRAAPASSG